jgi:hypothetical protein
MQTKIIQIDMYPMRKECQEEIVIEPTRNEAKHKATCLKNKLKRRRKKR